MDSITDNSHRTLWGIIKAAGIPDYFRDGVLVDADDAASIPDALFADSVNRRFPITDRANTFASAGYFAKTASEHGYSGPELDFVEARIRGGAKAYGILDDVDEAMRKVAEADRPVMDKSAADDISNYCDPEHKGYPVFDREGAELANSFFEKHAYKYGHARRMDIARNIMRKSAEYGVPVSEQVRLSAGDGYPNRETLSENLLFRAHELMERGVYKMAEQLCKFAQEIIVSSDEDLDENRKGIFDAIAGMDEVTGIDDCYGRKFCAPEEVVFDVTPDSIRDLIEDAVPMGSDTFSARALSELPRRLFEKVLPSDMVDGMMEGGKISPKKLSVTIVSLKSPEKTHLKRTIRDFTDGLIDIDEDDGGDEPEEIEIIPEDGADEKGESEKSEKSENPEKSDKSEKDDGDKED